LQRLQKKVLKKIKAHLISNILSIILCTRYYKKYSKVREAKEIVDLKIWHYKHVIYELGNGGKNRNTQSELWSDTQKP
jgi:hypothetical protein